MVLGVARSLGTVPEDFKPPFYEQVNDGSLIPAIFKEYATVISTDDIAPGDVVVMHYGRFPQHVGIVANCEVGLRGLSVIHAYSPAGRVIEASLDDALLNRIVESWRVAWVN